MRSTDPLEFSVKQSVAGEAFRLLHGVTAPVFVLDQDGRILWFNGASQELCGFSLDEVKGSLLWDRLVVSECVDHARRSYVVIPAQHCALVMSSKNGLRFRRRWYNRWVPDADGETVHIVMTGSEHDVAWDGQAEMSHKDSLELLLERMRDHAIFMLDRDGNVSSWSIAGQRILGYRPDNILGCNVSTFYLPDQTAAGQPARHLAAAAQDGHVENEHGCPRADGGSFRAQMVITARYDVEGRLNGFIAFIRDVSEKKRAEDMLTRLGRILDASLNEVYVFDAQTLRMQQVNQGVCLNLGFTRDEMEQLTLPDIQQDIDHEAFQVLAEPLRSGKKRSIQFTTLHRRKDGTLYPAEVHLQLLQVDAEPLFVAIVLDLTERRRVEEALQKTEIRLQTLFNAAPEFIFLIDQEGNILQLNRYAVEQSGYSESELVGHNIKEFFSEASQHICDCNFPVLRERGQTRSDIEFLCKDGGALHMECLATGIPDEGGAFGSFLIIQRDVTERVQAAAALADSERRFRTLFNSSFQLIGLLNPHGVLLEVNQTALDLCGLTDLEVVGKPFWETVWWSRAPEARERLKAAIAEAADGKLVRYEAAMAREATAALTVDFSLKPVVDAHGRTVLIIWEGRDITQRKLAEEEARRHQRELAHVARLNTMGEMASGMAHELNQPLAALVSYCGSAQALIAASPEVPENAIELLERAAEQAHRAGDIIRHLREFVSKGSTNKDAVDLDQLIREVSDFFEWELRNSNVRILLRLDSKGRRVKADKVQIEQVIINLIRNSLEALQSADMADGRLLIETLNPDDTRIIVTVHDNGPGIDPAMAGKIFDPFQTSKEAGMGMGLSISRSIINAHGGKLWLDETHQDGVSFGFELGTCD